MDLALLFVWDAKKHAHGTTTSRLKLQKSHKWPRYARDYPDAGQWTVVSVLPSAVVQAARTEEEKMGTIQLPNVP